MSSSVGESPREHDGREGLIDLEDKVDREQLLAVLWTPRQGVQRCGGSQGKDEKAGKNGRLALGVLNDIGGTTGQFCMRAMWINLHDIGNNSNSSGDPAPSAYFLCAGAGKTYMLYRIVWKGSSPKPCRMRGPKAEIPPDTRDAQKTIAAYIQALGSLSASQTWGHLKCVDWEPVLLRRMRSNEMYFCSSLNHLARVGWPGKMKKVGMQRAIALLVSFSAV